MKNQSQNVYLKMCRSYNGGGGGSTSDQRLLIRKLNFRHVYFVSNSIIKLIRYSHTTAEQRLLEILSFQLPTFA